MRADIRIFVPADELHMYRSHTLGLLRRYFRMSLQLGRLPALLGREIFRARVTTYRSASFEDLVIFVADVEHCLERLSDRQQQVIARVVFQEYTLPEAAALVHVNERTVRRLLAGGLDRLGEIFLGCGLLRPFPLHDAACQAPKTLLAMASR
jgi:AraC-like DNA-binding protein